MLMESSIALQVNDTAENINDTPEVDDSIITARNDSPVSNLDRIIEVEYNSLSNHYNTLALSSFKSENKYDSSSGKQADHKQPLTFQDYLDGNRFDCDDTEVVSYRDSDKFTEKPDYLESNSVSGSLDGDGNQQFKLNRGHTSFTQTVSSVKTTDHSDDYKKPDVYNEATGNEQLVSENTVSPNSDTDLRFRGSKDDNILFVRDQDGHNQLSSSNDSINSCDSSEATSLSDEGSVGPNKVHSKYLDSLVVHDTNNVKYIYSLSLVNNKHLTLKMDSVCSDIHRKIVCEDLFNRVGYARMFITQDMLMVAMTVDKVIILFDDELIKLASFDLERTPTGIYLIHYITNEQQAVQQESDNYAVCKNTGIIVSYSDESFFALFEIAPFSASKVCTDNKITSSTGTNQFHLDSDVYAFSPGAHNSIWANYYDESGLISKVAQIIGWRSGDHSNYYPETHITMTEYQRYQKYCLYKNRSLDDTALSAHTHKITKSKDYKAIDRQNALKKSLGERWVFCNNGCQLDIADFTIVNPAKICRFYTSTAQLRVVDTIIGKSLLCNHSPVLASIVRPLYSFDKQNNYCCYFNNYNKPLGIIKISSGIVLVIDLSCLKIINILNSSVRSQPILHTYTHDPSRSVSCKSDGSQCDFKQQECQQIIRDKRSNMYFRDYDIINFLNVTNSFLYRSRQYECLNIHRMLQAVDNILLCIDKRRNLVCIDLP